MNSFSLISQIKNFWECYAYPGLYIYPSPKYEHDNDTLNNVGGEKKIQKTKLKDDYTQHLEAGLALGIWFWGFVWPPCLGVGGLTNSYFWGLNSSTSI